MKPSLADSCHLAVRPQVELNCELVDSVELLVDAIAVVVMCNIVLNGEKSCCNMAASSTRPFTLRAITTCSYDVNCKFLDTYFNPV